MKYLILVVPPNDDEINRAVGAWEQRGYVVETHPIVNLNSVTEDLIKSVYRYDDVRVLFTESAWGNIPSEERRLLLDKLLIEPKVRWVHFAKKKNPSD